jgi:hypothetical protein
VRACLRQTLRLRKEPCTFSRPDLSDKEVAESDQFVIAVVVLRIVEGTL